MEMRWGSVKGKERCELFGEKEGKHPSTDEPGMPTRTMPERKKDRFVRSSE